MSVLSSEVKSETAVSTNEPAPDNVTEVTTAAEVVESVKPPTLMYLDSSIRARVPQELKDLPQWMIWSNTWLKKTGTWAKQPRRIEAGINDKNVSRKRYSACGYKDTLTTLDDAIAKVDQVSFLSGVGFALIGTGITGVDIDGFVPGCEWAEEIIGKFEAIGAYVEVSPSGKGVRIFCRGKLTAALSHKFDGEHTAIESWDNGRYVTVTGVPLARDGAEVGKLWATPGTPERGGRDLPDGQEVLDWLQAKYRKQPLPAEVTTAHKSSLAAYKPAPGESNDDTDYPWACEVLFHGHFDGLVDDYHSWLKVGMTLVSRFGPHAGADLWDRWSQRGANYQTGICRMKVSSFKKDGLNFGSFVEWARQAGAPLQAKNDPDHPDRWQKRPTPAIMAPQSTAETEESYTPGQGECEWDEPAEDSPASEYLSDEEFVRLVNDCMPGGHTDAQFAKLVLTIHGDRVRYVPEWHKERPWLAYDGRKGVWDRTEILQQRFVLQVANRILDKHGKTPLAQSSKLESCCKVMRLDPAIATRAREIDAEPFILNVANGVLNLKTLELQPHSPACLSLKQSPVKYDPIATAPKWVENLAKYLPDKDVRDYVQRYLGSALLGKPVTEALLFHGVGANGKTTVTATVGRVLGDADAGGYAAKMPQGFCAESKNDKHPTELTLLHGARLALASETKAVDRLDESKIKSIQGDGTIQARGLYENFWSFEPTHNLILSVNPLPKIAGRDDGIWRRWRFVHWPYQVPDEERIQEYDKVLFDEEGAGILNWLLEGLADYLANGMRPPAVVLAETAAVRESGNWAGQLVEDYTGYELDGETPLDPRINRVKLGDVYARYAQQCKDGGEKALNANLAGKPIRDAFEAAGFECRQVKNLWWILSAREKTEADIQNELDRDIYEGV